MTPCFRISIQDISLKWADTPVTDAFLKTDILSTKFTCMPFQTINDLLLFPDKLPLDGTHFSSIREERQQALGPKLIISDTPSSQSRKFSLKKAYSFIQTLCQETVNEKSATRLITFRLAFKFPISIFLIRAIFFICFSCAMHTVLECTLGHSWKTGFYSTFRIFSLLMHS